MRNPFTSIVEGDRAKVVAAWLTAGVVVSGSSGWDLLTYEDEWGLYTLGQVRRLAAIAGVGLEVLPVDLGQLLASPVVADTMEARWISGVQSVDDVYVDLILEFAGAPMRPRVEP